MKLNESASIKAFSSIDYFIHPHLYGNADLLHRARLLIAVLLIYSAVVLTASLIMLVCPIELVSKLLGMSICLALAASLLYLLFQLRRGGDYHACRTRVIALIFVAVVLGICVSGGPGQSPVIQLLPVPPLMAYFFGGVRWGGYTVAAALGVILGLSLLKLAGVNFAQTIAPNQFEINSALVSFVGFCAVCGMAFIYEFTTERLQRERDRVHQSVLHLAQTDALTGLANRRNFETELLARASACTGLDPAEPALVLGCFDLDGFKPINDRYGHSIGDEVLRAVSERLRNALRDSDFVGRQGGDEFMLILERVPDRAYLEQLALRLLSSVAQPISTGAGLISITGSVGFALFPSDASDVDTLKTAADAAMYAAKRTHSGCCFFEPGLLRQSA